MLSQVPTGTPVVVLDATGTAVPLATQAAANIIKTGDPIWCPTGQTPGGAGCTAAETNVGSVITDLGSKTAADGTVYFTSSYATNDATFDGSTSALTAWANYQLTLQGGWNGSTGGSYGLSGVTTFTVPVSVINWNNDVTINDITISGATGDGLTVTEASGSTGNINLNNVKSNGNSGRGAKLDNSKGSGAITVTSTTYSGDPSPSSQFNNNGGDGLDASSTSDITLTDVTASGSTGGAGAVLDNCIISFGSCTSGNNSSSISGAPGQVIIDPSTFNNNWLDGLDVTSNGFINLIDVTADNNGQSGISGSGAVLDNSASTNPYAVELDYSTGNEFNGNYNDGLNIHSKSNINIDGVTADGNLTGDGAYLNNTYSTTSSAMSVDFLTGASSYFGESGAGNSNGANGLEVYSNGDVYLVNVTADNNVLDGALLGSIADPIGGSICVDFNCSTSSAISGSSSEFNGNTGGDGLHISTKGDVTLTDVTSSSNTGYGTFIKNLGSTNVDFTLSDVTADGNTVGDGAYIYNIVGSAGVDHSSFDGNQRDGLEVFSGDLSFLNVDASGNNSGGAYIESGGNVTFSDVTADGNTGVGGGVSIDNTTGSGYVSIDPSTFDGNTGGNGLHILTNGDVTLSGVDANGNTGEGVSIDNTTGSGYVSIDPSTFDGNTGGDGLHILTNGAVTLTEVDASGNAGVGTYIKNVGSTNVDFTLSDVTADGNTVGRGAYIWNTAGPVGVDQSSFDGNQQDGLFIFSGDLSFLNVEANGNITGNGAFIESGGYVSIDPSTFDGNQQDGLSISSTGDASLSGVDANGNTGEGVSIGSSGNVTLTDVTSSGNAAGGVSINNTTGSGYVSIDPSTFDGNTGGDGLHILTNGAVTLTEVDASGNAGVGTYIKNVGSTNVDFTLSDVTADGNTVGRRRLHLEHSRPGWRRPKFLRWQPAGRTVHLFGRSLLLERGGQRQYYW